MNPLAIDEPYLPGPVCVFIGVKSVTGFRFIAADTIKLSRPYQWVMLIATSL